MPPSHPFLVGDSGESDTDRVFAEAAPVVKLVAMIVILALVPFMLGVAVMGPLGVFSFLGQVLVLLAQFVLVVGGAVVLMYVVSRAIQIAET
ncbi:MAG: hypothetical protein ABEJ55_05505 [Halanaeroarchaeum sp.]